MRETMPVNNEIQNEIHHCCLSNKNNFNYDSVLLHKNGSMNFHLVNYENLLKASASVTLH